MISLIALSGYLDWAAAGRSANARPGRAASPSASRSRRLMMALPGDSGGSLLAPDLGAVHDASAPWIECIAPVHGAAIVPQDEIPDAPDVPPRELRPIDEPPQLIEQRLRLREIEPEQIGIAS